MTPGKVMRERVGMGISVEDAARLSGISLRTWLRWESGESSAPHLLFYFFEVLKNDNET